MVRHGDTGVPNWLVDSEELGSQTARENLGTVLEVTTSISERVTREYTRTHNVTIGDLVEAGLIDEDDELTQDMIADALSDYINDDYIDRYDCDPHDYDHEYYDSDWTIDSYGGLEIE